MNTVEVSAGLSFKRLETSPLNVFEGELSPIRASRTQAYFFGPFLSVWGPVRCSSQRANSYGLSALLQIRYS